MAPFIGAREAQAPPAPLPRSRAGSASLRARLAPGRAAGVGGHTPTSARTLPGEVGGDTRLGEN